MVLTLEDLAADGARPRARVRPLLVAVVVLGAGHLLAANLAGDDLVEVVEVVVDHAQRRAQLPAHGTHRVLLLLVAVGHVTGEPRLGKGALAVLAPEVLSRGQTISYRFSRVVDYNAWVCISVPATSII